MEKYKYCEAIIRAINGIHIDKNLTDDEKLAYENTLIELREKLLNENLLEKASFADSIGRIAEVSRNDDRTRVEFDVSKLNNVLGNNIERVIGRIEGNVSIGVRQNRY
jgi:hypothetical protein